MPPHQWYSLVCVIFQVFSFSCHILLTVTKSQIALFELYESIFACHNLLPGTVKGDGSTCTHDSRGLTKRVFDMVMVIFWLRCNLSTKSIPQAASASSYSMEDNEVSVVSLTDQEFTGLIFDTIPHCLFFINKTPHAISPWLKLQRVQLWLLAFSYHNIIGTFVRSLLLKYILC